MSVGHGGAAQIVQPLSDPSPPLGPLSCARGELARSVSGTPLRRNLTPVDTGNRFYFEIQKLRSLCTIYFHFHLICVCLKVCACPITSSILCVLHHIWIFVVAATFGSSHSCVLRISFNGAGASCVPLAVLTYATAPVLHHFLFGAPFADEGGRTGWRLSFAESKSSRSPLCAVQRRQGSGVGVGATASVLHAARRPPSDETNNPV